MTPETGQVAHFPRQVARGSGESDLWCTYAALRTLRWIDRMDAVAEPHATERVLRNRRNPDGGYSWTRGMASDAWATFYCTAALRDLGVDPDDADSTAAWIDTTWTGNAYGMQPGQNADVWATHFSVRTQVEVCQRPIPDPTALSEWLGSTQGRSGGLTWTPEHAVAGAPPDVRACYYGVLAADTAGLLDTTGWDTEALVSWIRGLQTAHGGFRLNSSSKVPCMWATYRAVGALYALGAQPSDPARCEQWILSMRPAREAAFIRWPGYDKQDVWASFCAVGALQALQRGKAAGWLRGDHEIVAEHRKIGDAVSTRIATMALGNGGYTYVEPEVAGDALSTAAAVLADPDRLDTHELRSWLEGCLLPNENGVMYMPGRGAEVRCTLWALSAGAFARRSGELNAIAAWVAALQNPDGGFGYWEGRGSDMVSTVSALNIVQQTRTRIADTIDRDALLRFIESCRGAAVDGSLGYSNVPDGPIRMRPTLQALRSKVALEQDVRGDMTAVLNRHAVTSGGWADEGARVPDLLTTYEAVLASDRAGVTLANPVPNLLRSLNGPDGTRWSPLAPTAGGPLSSCLAALLTRRFESNEPLPSLTLS